MMSLAHSDLRRLEIESWIDRATVEPLEMRRVDTVEGATLVNRNDREDYAGIIFPIYWPGVDRPREFYLRRDHPPSEGDKPKGKYLAPPGRGNLLMFGRGE